MISMLNKTIQWMCVAVAMAATVCIGWARDLDTVAITIPLRSKLSLVQRLNRDGVQLVEKHQYDKAESLFLKAYLYDPADPFTLNNLGYIAELQGQMDRAQKFYELASKQGCNAVIDRSSLKELEGRPMRAAIDGLQDGPMRINQQNVEAIRLLSQERSDAAVALLKRALAEDPQNPFTLNNLGVASEAVGNYPAAIRYYQQVAKARSSEAVIVADDPAWRGRSISDMARASAARLQKLMAGRNPDYSQAAMLDRRGVVAINQNDWAAAKEAFLQAYSLDPASAFSLNNRGYVAEMEGDLETAQFYYEKAAKAQDADMRVGLATQSSAEGRQLLSVAADSDNKVDSALAIYSQQRHLQTAPIELTPRGAKDNSIPEQQKPSSPSTPVPAEPQNLR